MCHTEISGRQWISVSAIWGTSCKKGVVLKAHAAAFSVDQALSESIKLGVHFWVFRNVPQFIPRIYSGFKRNKAEINGVKFV